MLPAASANALVRSGYRITSRKHRMISRIDRPDWQEHMAQRHSPWSIEEGMRWVGLLGKGAGDHYRRCYSEDTIEVDAKTFQFLLSRGGRSPCNEFLEKNKYSSRVLDL